LYDRRSSPRSKKPRKHAIYGLVVDGRDVEAAAAGGIAGAGGGGFAVALEEGIDVGREQLAVARRHAQRAVGHAEVDRAVERQQPAVGAVAPGHGVGIRAGVGGQLLVQREDRQVLGVEIVVDRQEIVVLGVEHEDQAQEEGQEPGVDVIGPEIGIAVGGGEGAVGGAAVGGLEAREQDVQGLEDLIGEGPGDAALGLARGGEERGELMLGRDAEPARAVEQHDEGVEDGPAVGAGHGADREGEGAGRGAVGRVQQADVGAVGQEADGARQRGAAGDRAWPTAGSPSRR
jgi:hypothetical protein